ncbi:MAG: hypothetical protein KDA22_05300 [Phycisphaerales bacterium]|nr:hypothetical protein [Phycisphaerales bacterium]
MRTIAAALLLTFAPALEVAAGTIVVPDDAPSIQAAVTLASDGDVIELAAGVYTGPGNRNVELQGKLLTIRSVAGAATCTIDCQYLGRAFRAIAGEPMGTTLEGLTITHGHVGGTNQQAGAVEVAEGAHLALIDCHLVANALGMKGRGGAIASFGSLVLDGCVFESNTVSDDFSLGAAVLMSGEATIVDCAFIGNSTNEGIGGAVSAYGSLTLAGTIFEGNHGKYGGALDASGPFEITDCSFDGNTALSIGGAMRLAGPGGTVTGVLFRGNSAPMGGAIVCGSASLVFERCQLVDNQAGINGGGGARIIGTGATAWWGCLFNGNGAVGSGGAIAVAGGSCEVLDCTVTANACGSGGVGGGVFVEATGAAQLSNSVLWGNTGPSASLQEQQVAADGSVFADACCIEGLDGSLGGIGNIGGDPAFVDPVGSDGLAGTLDDDLRLAAGSPCIDGGANLLVPPALALDLDHGPRVVDGDADGFAVVDIGAYERSAAPAGDLDGDGIVNGADLGILLAAWGGAGPGDLNDDGVVDGADLGILLAEWTP